MPEVTIERLGRQGDGIFSEDGKEFYVPYSLVDERVEISGKGRRRKLVSIVEPSMSRIDPLCGHFGDCGGCQVQHMQSELYQSWKIEILASALEQAGISHEIDQFVTFPSNSRRKVVFSANRTDGKLNFGFSRQHSDEIVSIEECPVLEPALQAGLPNLVTFATSLPLQTKPARIGVLATDGGLDVHVEELRIKSEPQRRALGQKALDLQFARLSIDGEVVIEARKPTLKMGRALVIPPPGAFVQASKEAENAMALLVSDYLSSAKKAADLFCGIGTFALRLAEQSQVWALEENAPAIDALDKAWRETAGTLKQITTEVRNLDRRPVSFKELKNFDAVVFDPPRAGAELQSHQIAKSNVKKVAAVSCYPATLARDLTILIDGGYKIKKIVTFDQFKFTHHLEAIALLEK